MRQNGRIPSARILAALISSRLNCFPLGVVIPNLLLGLRKTVNDWLCWLLVPTEDVDEAAFETTDAASLESVGWTTVVLFTGVTEADVAE